MSTMTADKKAELLANHYQKTFELNYDLWKERNRTFLLLLAAVAIEALLTFRGPTTTSLAGYVIASLLNITNPDQISELQRSFPFSLLQSVLLLAVFYLMVNLHHRMLWVLRNYRYLEALEGEIRTTLGLPESSVAFARESGFYWSSRGALQDKVKYVYTILLGALLVFFLAGRLVYDLRARDLVLTIADVVVGIPTLAFFLAYAKSSITSDASYKRKQ